MTKSSAGIDKPKPAKSGSHLVVARKYRPQDFAGLVGQQQVATALGNAIEQHRVGHAYLFTGARGVGKTSAARIFAKCLNCKDGPTLTPCQQCDACQSISVGDDIDVLEIDGASNRGIDEIRQLRANANVRPSRSTNKIYIIDEVHMLTSQAFNALLKTLEEPPGHVKFVFCTTDPDKVPITVLSRCQRFDFPPIQTTAIKDRLQVIVEQEGKSAEPQALELLARRAGGSMRDSQSLLEQLLSFAPEKITESDVHSLLGTADYSRVFAIAQAIVDRKSNEGLGEIDQAIADGVDAGQLAEQILGLFRDIMAAKVGCGAELMQHTAADDLERVKAFANSLGMETILAILQAFDQTLVRMRQNAYPRLLIEAAVVRTSHLENLDQIPQLLRQLQSGAGGLPAGQANQPVSRPPAKKSPPEDVGRAIQSSKKNGIVKDVSNSSLASTASRASDAGRDGPENPPPASKITWSESNLPEVWSRVVDQLGDLTAEVAGSFESLDLGPGDCLKVVLKTPYARDLCQRPERKTRLEQAVYEATGKRVRLEFSAAAGSDSDPTPPPPAPSKRQQIREAEHDPFVRAAIEIFDAEITEVRGGRPK